VSWPILRYFSDTHERTIESSGNRKVGLVLFRRHCLLMAWAFLYVIRKVRHWAADWILQFDFICFSNLLLCMNLCKCNIIRFPYNILHAMFTTVKFLRIKVPCTFTWPYTEGTWLYCDYEYFIWVYLVLCFNLYCGCFNLSCNVWVCVCEGFVMCGCFGNIYAWIYCVLYCLYYVFCIRLCIFICFVCTSVRNTATPWQFNCS